MSTVSEAVGPKRGRRVSSPPTAVPDAGQVYFTVQEAASLLRCSTKTIRRYIARGDLLGYRVGPIMLRIQADELDAMVTSRALPNARTR